MKSISAEFFKIALYDTPCRLEIREAINRLGILKELIKLSQMVGEYLIDVIVSLQFSLILDPGTNLAEGYRRLSQNFEDTGKRGSNRVKCNGSSIYLMVYGDYL
uniref:Uncharacterized protein n=1 Tax=Megaselia scalaris TaxID=36166 RepID=T1GJD3_MEGSC